MNFELEIQKHFKRVFSKTGSKPSSKKEEATQQLLKKALLYSFKGKASHFRPRLCFETAKTLAHKPAEILPWAISLEMVHTASLIHDDMPCMDKAETRRDRKCNHLVFGEDIALLAGTCLFVESFSLLNAPLFDKKKSEFLDLLVKTVGFHGLMSGQAMDLKNKSPNKKELLNTMNLKTGILISACVLGPALLWANKKEYKALESFAKHLGLAYQLADDYQDLTQDSVPATKNCKDRNLFKSQKSWLYKEGLSQLEKSSKALSLLKKNNKGLNSLIREIKQRFLPFKEITKLKNKERK